MLRRRAPWLLASLLLWTSLGLHGCSGADLVRLRNALTWEPHPASDFTWAPDTAPADYLRETATAPPALTSTALRLKSVPFDELLTSQRIVEHLLTSAPRLLGGGARDHLEATYERITREGRGYCADFVRVFEGLAAAAGLHTRIWSFSFNGFGGGGHQLAEVWDGSQWRLLDVFNNVVFLDVRGEVLDALQLQDALRRSEPLRSRPLVPAARLGYPNPLKLEQYYRRGRDEWWLHWGSNPFARDVVIRSFGPLRPVAQLVLVAYGDFPPARAVRSPGSGKADFRMLSLKLHALLVVLATPVLVLAAVFIPLRRQRGHQVAE